MLTTTWYYGKLNELSERHELQNIRKRTGMSGMRRKAAESAEKLLQKKLKKCLTRSGRCDKVNELSERQEP